MENHEDLGSLMAAYADVLDAIRSTEKELDSLARLFKDIGSAIEREQTGRLRWNRLEITDVGIKVPYGRDQQELTPASVSRFIALTGESKSAREYKSELDDKLREIGQSVLIQHV